MSYSQQTRSVRRTQTREGDSTKLVKVETQATSTALRTGGAGLGLYVRVGFTPLDKAGVGLMSPLQTVREQSYLTGFTFIEILIVIVIIGIVAMIAVPMISSSASMQIHSAANMVAADLEYAKSMAISRGQNFSVVFDKSAESYSIENQDGDVIEHPVKKGFNYIVSFGDDSRLDSVDIVDVDFDPGSNQTITFDYLGSPHSGTEATNPLNSGIITLQAGGITKTISIEAVTGYISIAD
jgi:prepilin-type N-terminal cleavage/methylation domain-containing protein